MSDPIRLNLGGGDVPLPGFTTIDRKQGSEVYPLDYVDKSVDEIYCSHTLEHFSHRETLKVLREWVRVLKPGGRLRVAVPDIEFCARQLLAGNPHGLPLEGFIMGGQVDENDFHKAQFNEAGLRILMEAAGLRRVRRWKSEIRDCAALPVSLNLEGYKPDYQEPQGVVAITSRPRLGFNLHHDCLFRTLPAMGIPLIPGDGVFWGIVLTKCMEAVIASGAKYILTIDYDTVFGAENVLELYRLMEARPEADAICPLQVRRDSDAALLVMKNPDGSYRHSATAEEFQDDLTRVDSAHFGLTMLRTERIKQLPKPWFHAVPDEDGGWGDKAVHEDVSFWNKWKEAGFTLFQGNYVSVGHLECVIKWMKRDMTPEFQYTKEWREQGPPVEVAR